MPIARLESRYIIATKDLDAMGEKKFGVFDGTGFYEALESTRLARGMNWKEVAKASGVSASTLTRIAQGKRPDVDSLAALVTWSGLDADQFLCTGLKQTNAEPLALISTYLRSDKQLSPKSAQALDQIIRTAYEQMRKRG